MPTHWPRKEWSWSVYLATASHRSPLQDFLVAVEDANRPRDSVRHTPNKLGSACSGHQGNKQHCTRRNRLSHQSKNGDDASRSGWRPHVRETRGRRSSLKVLTTSTACLAQGWCCTQAAETPFRACSSVSHGGENLGTTPDGTPDRRIRPTRICDRLCLLRTELSCRVATVLSVDEDL